MLLLILISLSGAFALLLAGFMLNNTLTLPALSADTKPETIVEARNARLMMLILAGFLFYLGVLLFVVSHLIPLGA